MSVAVKRRSEKVCVCYKERHQSKGAAEAQIRGLQKLQTIDNGKKDFKDISKLHAYRSSSCEKAIRDGKEIWHVGHR